jgi:hypothetical protein
MTTVMFDVFVYILALYGAVYLVIGFVDSIRKRFKNENKSIKFILLVKNQEGCIEGIIRDIFIGNSLGGLITQDSFTVLDMGSTDETLKILEKLKRDYQYLNVLNYEEKNEIFKYFEEDNLSSLKAN